MALTVKDFAKTLKISDSALLERMQNAGLSHSKNTDEITAADKQALLKSLKGAKTTSPKSEPSRPLEPCGLSRPLGPSGTSEPSKPFGPSELSGPSVQTWIPGYSWLSQYSEPLGPSVFLLLDNGEIIFQLKN